MMFGQHALQQEAKQSGGEHCDRDGKREPIGTHSHPQARSRQLAAPRRERNRRGASIRRIARRGRNGANHAETIVSRGMTSSATMKSSGAAATPIDAPPSRGLRRACSPARRRRTDTGFRRVRAEGFRQRQIHRLHLRSAPRRYSPVPQRAGRQALWIAGRARFRAEAEGREARLRNERRHVRAGSIAGRPLRRGPTQAA